MQLETIRAGFVWPRGWLPEETFWDHHFEWLKQPPYFPVHCDLCATERSWESRRSLHRNRRHIWRLIYFEIFIVGTFVTKGMFSQIFAHGARLRCHNQVLRTGLQRNSSILPKEPTQPPEIFSLCMQTGCERHLHEVFHRNWKTT